MAEVDQGQPLRPLNVPSQPRVRYRKNLIRLATCEVRFPTILALESAAPESFQKAVRKLYPIFERGANVDVQPGGVEREARYLFWSRHRDWTITLRSSSLAIETRTYTRFRDFKQRMTEVLAIAKGLIDSDFFTRVGLRYINVLPAPISEATQWVNRDLVAPLADGIYGDVDGFFQQVSGPTQAGKYSFRHGVAQLEGSGKPEYLLDFDFYREDVEAGQVGDLLEAFNRDCFALFFWTLGPRAREHMGEPIPEEEPRQ